MLYVKKKNKVRLKNKDQYNITSLMYIEYTIISCDDKYKVKIWI